MSENVSEQDNTTENRHKNCQLRRYWAAFFRQLCGPGCSVYEMTMLVASLTSVSLGAGLGLGVDISLVE